MKMARLLMLAAAVCFTAAFSLAHDGEFGWDDPFEIPGLGSDVTVEVTHEDGPDGSGLYKGFAFIGTKNTGTENWTAMRFFIFDAVVGGITYDATSVLIIDSASFEPSSLSHPVSSWVLGTTDTGHAMLDVEFSTSVAPNQTLLVQFYTDNTAESVPFFGIGFYPIPEPASGSLVALVGGFGLLIRRLYGFRR